MTHRPRTPEGRTFAELLAGCVHGSDSDSIPTPEPIELTGTLYAELRSGGLGALMLRLTGLSAAEWAERVDAVFCGSAL